MSNSDQNKPRTVSQPNEWHEITFRISVDKSADWDNIDLREWARRVSRYTAYTMAKSTNPDLDTDSNEVIHSLVMGVQVNRISLVNDESLYQMIAEFEDE